MAAIFSKQKSETNDLKRFMDEAYVTSPYTDEIFKMIRELHSTVESKPRIGLLLGCTDSGKTSAINRYVKDYLEACEKSHEYKDSKPFLRGTMSAASTRHEMMTQLLRSAGDIHPTKGKLFEKEDRLVALAKTLDSSMAIIDDFGRLLRDSGTSFNKTMCNYIQYIMEEKLKIPFLLSGVEECRLILDQMKELKRRAPFKYNIKPFRMNSSINAKHFVQFLKALEQGIPKKSVSISSGNMPKRMFVASNGVPGPIKTIIEQAYILSGDNPTITLTHFEQAYDRIYEESIERENTGNQLFAKAKLKSRNKSRVIDDSYSYQAPFNPFREGISTIKLDRCIGASYE